MGRLINTESAAKLRTQLTRSVVLALRELSRRKNGWNTASRASGGMPAEKSILGSGVGATDIIASQLTSAVASLPGYDVEPMGTLIAEME